MATHIAAAAEDKRLGTVAQPVKLLDRVAELWNSSFFSSHAGAATFWLLFVAIAAARALIGMSGMRVFSLDGFMVLDGAWRMVNGQRPHIDFNSMIGPVAYLPTILGFQFCNGTAAGFGYGQAIMALVLGGWAYGLGSGLRPASRVVYALCVAAIAGSPALVGASPFDLSPGMSYNRYTYALLGLLVLECMRGPEKSEFIGGLSSGAVLGLVAFLKMTGVVIEAFLLVSLLPMRRQTRQRWTGFFCGLVLICAPLLAYMHFQVGLIWQDLRITAGAKHMVFYDRFDFGSLFLEGAFALLLTIEAAHSVAASHQNRVASRALWGVGAVLMASLALILGNFQRATMPLLTLAMVIVIDAVTRSRAANQERLREVRSLVVSGASIFVAVIGLSLAASLLSGLSLRAFVVPHRPVFHAPALAGFVPVGDNIMYTHWANDGFDLLASHRRPGEHVMSLDFANPFLFGLHLPPAPGGTSNIQYRGSFDDQHKLSPERLFGSAELVMVPMSFSDPSLRGNMLRIYGPYLYGHYTLVGQSEDWKLYRRNG